MDYGACADGDVTLELDILADDGFGVDGEFVATWMTPTRPLSDR